MRPALRRPTPAAASSNAAACGIKYQRAPAGARRPASAARPRQRAAAPFAAAAPAGDAPIASAPPPLPDLTGVWLADYRASANRPALLAALGLSGLARVTADRLIEGVRVDASPGGRLTVAYLSVVPFIAVSETFDPARATRSPRRDGRAGDQEGRLKAGEDGPIVTITWGEPAAATLVERYTVSDAGRTLSVTATLTPARGGAAVTATTIYRRAKGWTPKYSYPGGGETRRAALAALAAAALARPAAALPPGTRPALSDPFARVGPAPPVFPRKVLGRALAVLLLRSCYDALEGMRVCPMDVWQGETFWRRRTGAWEPYIDARARAGAAVPRPSQGELTDPAYFDFISAVQWDAIDDALGSPQAAFDEACDPDPDSGDAGCPDGGRRRVERAGGVPASLAAARAEFFASAGAMMLSNMRAGFQGVSFAVPPSPSTPADAPAALAALATTLVDGGYALAAKVEERAGGKELALRCEGPAVLWGAGGRAARGAPPNALDAVVASALLAAVVDGRPAVTVTATATEAVWRLKEKRET